ncbi:MAG: aldehyde dehydrogenase family protein, partial [Dysgonamonadaceae bacterium]|nr:aldehyde dehydrogenase family protein [Dysgonamonadaceae bacterium]
MLQKAIQYIKNMPINSVWIDNEWKRFDDLQSIPIINPSTGEHLISSIISNKDVVDAAVISAKAAFYRQDWKEIHPSKRGEILYRVSELLKENKELLSILETLNNGKTITDARQIDLEETIQTFRYFAGWADKIKGDVIQSNKDILSYTVRQPVGVVGAIIPWNYPLIMAAWKLAPALAMGNTIILKPSELTPITAMVLMEILKEAGLPAGVVNLVTGNG